MHSVDATWQDIIADAEGVLSFDDVTANEMLFREVAQRSKDLLSDVLDSKSDQFDPKSVMTRIL